ncbi:MAG TPA: rhomboid family protein [Lentisphaeria bacterium]|nr:MAG: hypothetical protein A2X48_05425 [Lentisphaerae bacterium GWF2_49_21]HBC86139.1 rhomboid family protein [Lentisphaeria bacterium]
MSGFAVLKTIRCRNHPEREAVARCPDCGHDFCRECVTEHGGRMLCAGCLGKTRKKFFYQRTIFKLSVKTALFIVGLATAWLFFYLIGSILAEIPDEYHGSGLDGWSVSDD